MGRVGWFATLGLVVIVMLGLMRPVATDRGESGAHAKARLFTASLTVALMSYRSEYHTLPVGTQAEIVRALGGDNARKIVFFEAGHGDFNAAGEVIDPWKTPYRIVTSDPDKPTVYSFGPNKKDDGNTTHSDDIGPAW